jgi:hypothetical protein
LGIRGAKLVRYDTRAAFGVATSWASFGVSTIDANVKGLAGGAFDGRWLYLVPNADRMTLRFDVKDRSERSWNVAGSGGSTLASKAVLPSTGGAAPSTGGVGTPASGTAVPAGATGSLTSAEEPQP